VKNILRLLVFFAVFATAAPIASANGSSPPPTKASSGNAIVDFFAYVWSLASI